MGSFTNVLTQSLLNQGQFIRIILSEKQVYKPVKGNNV